MATIIADDDNRYEVVIIKNDDRTIGGLVTSGTVEDASRSVFGEQGIVEINPVVQVDGLYGIADTDIFQRNSSGTGTQSVTTDGLMTVSSGTGSGAFSTLRTRRAVRYRPGQGSLCRFTAMFPTGHTAGYQQVAGFLNQSDIIGVGYNSPTADTQFSVLRRYNGKGEIYQIDVTAGASGAESIDIVLNGTTFTVAVTSGTAAFNAAQIGSATYTQWIVDYVGTTVYFLSDGVPGDLTGTFSVTNTTAGGTFAATGTTAQNGANPTDNWVAQDNWNIDRLDGTGPSGMTLNPANLNVFQIDFRWLGAGIIRWSIEDAISGNLIPFHIEHYSNRNTVPSISNPSLRIGYGVANAAPGVGTGSDVIVRGASIMGAIEGVIPAISQNTGVSRTAASLSQNDTHHILTLKNDRITANGTTNLIQQREVLLESISFGVTATAGNVATIQFIKNASINDGAATPSAVNFLFTSVDGASVATNTAEYTANTGKVITGFTGASNSTQTVDLTPYRIILTPLDTVSIFSTCGIQHSVTAFLTFVIE